MLKHIALIYVVLQTAACSGAPRSDHDLTRQAERAVDDKLDVQGRFSLMEAVASQNIACGHVMASDTPGRSAVDQDFVYKDGRPIMDNDPDYEAAAIACDRATGDRNSAIVGNGIGR